MKHNIRINGEVKTVDFELGSDIRDENGNEIFEGDIVNVSNGFSPDCDAFEWERHKAFFCRGELILVRESEWHRWQTAGCIPANQIGMSTFEVLGPAND